MIDKNRAVRLVIGWLESGLSEGACFTRLHTEDKLSVTLAHEIIKLAKLSIETKTVILD